MKLMRSLLPRPLSPPSATRLRAEKALQRAVLAAAMSSAAAVAAAAARVAGAGPSSAAPAAAPLAPPLATAASGASAECVFVKHAGDLEAAFAPVEIFVGDAVCRLAERASSKFRWLVGADKIKLFQTQSPERLCAASPLPAVGRRRPRAVHATAGLKGRVCAARARRGG